MMWCDVNNHLIPNRSEKKRKQWQIYIADVVCCDIRQYQIERGIGKCTQKQNRKPLTMQPPAPSVQPQKTVALIACKLCAGLQRPNGKGEMRVRAHNAVVLLANIN